MSERKVLNKYYPPDFDPTQIPKLKGPKNRTFTIRIMAPFNMRCGTCGEYIYKGKKFNSRKETVENETYLGLHIHRFYIKCPRCVAEISFKTDPENTDYALEAGATRNFEAARTAAELDKKEQQQIDDEEANNPMKVLENRTKQSRTEMERIEQLEELRDLNARHCKVDHENLIKSHQDFSEIMTKLQEEQDEELVRSLFSGDKSEEGYIKRLHDSDDDDEDNDEPKFKIPKGVKPTDILTEGSTSEKVKTVNKGKVVLTSKTKSSISSKSSLLQGIVVKKKSDKNVQEHVTACGKVTENQDDNKETIDSHRGSDGSHIADKSGTEKSAPSGLSLLGNYSDSDSCESD